MLGKLTLAALLAIGMSLVVVAQQGLAQERFFEGKVIRIMVTGAAGGSYDAYARLIARHLSKHIPGNPTVVVENHGGAGGLIAQNYLYSGAKPDGLTLVHTNGAFALQQYIGAEGIQYDAPKFGWIGSAIRVTPICVITKSSGITSMNEWRNSPKPVKFGGMGPGTTISDHARILALALGLPMQLVEGYKGSAPIKLAMESGEVAGACGYAWETQAQDLGGARELINVVVQVAPKPHPEAKHVPLAISFARTDEERRLIGVGIQDMALLGHSWIAPPGTPPERLRLLRRAFQDTTRDPELLNDAKGKFVINPTPGEELASVIDGLAKLPPSLLEKFKGILLPK